MGVPLFAVLYSAVTEVVCSLLKKRGLPVDTNEYRGAKQLDPATGEFVEVAYERPPVSAKERRRAAEKARAQKQQEEQNKKD